MQLDQSRKYGAGSAHGSCAGKSGRRRCGGARHRCNVRTIDVDRPRTEHREGGVHCGDVTLQIYFISGPLHRATVSGNDPRRYLNRNRPTFLSRRCAGAGGPSVCAAHPCRNSGRHIKRGNFDEFARLECDAIGNKRANCIGVLHRLTQSFKRGVPLAQHSRRNRLDPLRRSTDPIPARSDAVRAGRELRRPPRSSSRIPARRRLPATRRRRPPPGDPDVVSAESQRFR